MSQPFALSCRGGLNVNLNQLEIMRQPGLATKLLNFEVDPDGGYRRISGFNLFGGGSSARPNSSNPVLGMAVYADGLVVCSGTGIFFSQDGTSWIQINKASVSGSGDNLTTFNARSNDDRTGQGQCTFSIFEGTTDYGDLLICDGANKPFFFRMTGTGNLSTRTFFAGEITVDGTTAPSVGVMHENHFVVGGASTAKNTIFFSSSVDPDSFSGSGAGSIQLTDSVVGLASFRSDLVIFCTNSIFRLVNISDSTNIAVVPVTRNVGCLDGQSIQEIGGDLLFLSPDGIRTFAGTARIGDVELSSVSRQIQKVTTALADNINNFTISSGVLRSKSQYRFKGEAYEIKDNIQFWNSLSEKSKLSWFWPTPGERLSEIKFFDNPKNLNRPDTFFALGVKIDYVELLKLERPIHKRCCWSSQDNWARIALNP